MKRLTHILNGHREVVFLDFEGTQFSHEIIAIGAIKCDLDDKHVTKRMYKKFKTYITPKEKVGRRVEQLTGLDREFLLKNGTDFMTAFNGLKGFIKAPYDNKTYITYGNFDLHLLKNMALMYGLIDDPFIQGFFKNYLDFAGFLEKFVRYQGCCPSLKNALKIFKLSFEGDEHDPLYDALNLRRLYDAFLTQKGILLEEYKKVIESHVNQGPMAKLIRKLNKSGSCTYEEYLEYIKEELK